MNGADHYIPYHLFGLLGGSEDVQGYAWQGYRDTGTFFSASLGTLDILSMC